MVIPGTIQGFPVVEIGRGAFGENSRLQEVVIPRGVKKISGFQNRKSLTSVTIPDSVTWIGEKAFSGCTSLATVTISPVKRNFNTLWGKDVHFGDCPKLSLASQAALRAAGYTGGFN